MQVLFMAQCYAPEDVSAAVLITELAVDLVKRGHQVTMLTGAPNYPEGRVFLGYQNRAYAVEWLDGVRVVRTWSYISSRKTFWPRLLHYGSYSATVLYGGLLASRPDIVVSYSPPLPLGISAWLLSRVWQAPWVLEIEDIYPDAAVAAGVLRNQRAIDFFTALERFLYRRATHISVISESFRRNLSNKGVPSEKLTLIPVWADPELVRPLSRDNAFRRQHGLTGKFVVMYAGNIGVTSCLEEVLGAAELLKEDADVRFVIVGEGVKKAALEAIARRHELTNILFMPFQPRAAFPEMLAAADLSLVTLNQRSALTSLPSKIFNIMASARPILAVAPLDSEIAQLVEDARCGVTVPPEEPARLAQAIQRLKGNTDRLAEMGEWGRIQLETRFSRKHCVDMYEQMLVDLVKPHPLTATAGSIRRKLA